MLCLSTKMLDLELKLSKVSKYSKVYVIFMWRLFKPSVQIKIVEMYGFEVFSACAFAFACACACASSAYMYGF